MKSFLKISWEPPPFYLFHNRLTPKIGLKYTSFLFRVWRIKAVYFISHQSETKQLKDLKVLTPSIIIYGWEASSFSQICSFPQELHKNYHFDVALYPG